jgi:L-amino acid N-acyltransferase YncA
MSDSFATGTLLVRPAAISDASAIAAIYNQGIADRSSTFESEPRTAEERAEWLAARGVGLPVLVAELGGAVVGWAAVSAYSPRGCYRGIGEASVYVDRDCRGQGVGRALLGAIVVEAEARGFWKLIGRVFASNQASLTLCRRCGFREVGTHERHAKLDGRWIDVVVVERLIPGNVD